MQSEAQKVYERYARRAALDSEERYSMLNPSVWQGVQERQRALIALLAKHASAPLSQLRVLEVGCGGGGNLLELLRMGFSSDNLIGNELLPERAALARKNLPMACDVREGDATQLVFGDESFDIVYQSVVFSSLLDNRVQQQLADKMWRWVRPGGGVLWYDFIYNNPSNPDVRGVPLMRVRELFPAGEMNYLRITLAPPISRWITRIHPGMYRMFNAVPFMRTHIICFIKKP